MVGRGPSLVRIQAKEKCLTVPGNRVIICPKGLFTPSQKLPAGTPVVVQLCGEYELTLLGIVRTTDADSGLAIEFIHSTESLSQKLVALFVA